MYCSREERKTSSSDISLLISLLSVAGISEHVHATLSLTRVKLQWRAPFCLAQVRDCRVRNKFQGGKAGTGRGHCILLLHNSLWLGIVDIVGGSKGWGAQKLRNN